MNIKDIIALASARLRVRKRRTVLTLITTSILFSLIITMFITAQGAYRAYLRHSLNVFDSGVVMQMRHMNTDGFSFGSDPPEEVQRMAVDLYEASTDPDKEHPLSTIEVSDDFSFIQLVQGNPFAEQALSYFVANQSRNAKDAVSGQAAPYGGHVLTELETYFVNGRLTIGGRHPHHTPLQFVVALYDDSIIDQFVQISEQRDDVIQILASLDLAAEVIGVNWPSWRALTPATLRDSVRTVNERALGYRFTGIVIDDEGEAVAEVTYEIVGLLPASSSPPVVSLFRNNPVHDIIDSFTTFATPPAIVVNPDSTAFRSSYSSGMHVRTSSVILVAFDDVSAADDFDQEHNCHHVVNGCTRIGDLSISGFIGDPIGIKGVHRDLSRLIMMITIAISVVAIIIMTTTLIRIVDDERQTIALYRAVGATTGNVLLVFVGYMFLISLLTIATATAIGLILSGIIAITHASTAAALLAASYNLPDVSSPILIGFAPQILLTYLTIIAVGLFCLIFVFDRLTNKEIVKDLRK
ncbi:ABC transporter permease [Candidatus Saccharibacteria bacterium]|nr:ABC transporter permease [Candidatus Saccharibacteria bacterium]